MREPCHCFGDVRQKSMYLLGRFECVKVQDILIARSGQVFVDGIELDQARAGSTDLARRVPAPLQELTAAQSERILEFCQGPQDVARVAKWFRVSEAAFSR